MEYYLCKISDLDCYKIDEKINEVVSFNPNTEIDDSYLLLQQGNSSKAFDFYTGATVMVTENPIDFIKEVIKEYQWYCYSSLFVSKDKLVKFDSMKSAGKVVTESSQENTNTIRKRIEELKEDSTAAVKVISDDVKKGKNTLVKKFII